MSSESKNQPVSSYTLFIGITFFMGLLSLIIPSGSFDYMNYTTTAVMHPQEPLSISYISEHHLTPVLNSFHMIPKPSLSFSEIASAPIMGFQLSGPYIIFTLILGVFLQMIQWLEVFPYLLQKFSQYRFTVHKTVSVILLCIAILSSVSGLRDENVFFLLILLPLRQYYGLHIKMIALIILLGTVVGIGSSLLNPTTVGIFSSLSTTPIAQGFGLRLIIFIILYLCSLCILLPRLSRYTDTKLIGNFPLIQFSKRYQLGIFVCIISAIALITLLILGYSLQNAETYFLTGTILSTIIAGKKEYEIVQNIKLGAQSLLPVGINLALTRGIMYVLELTGIKDTLSFSVMHVLIPSLPIAVFAVLMILVILGFFLIVNTSSGASSFSYTILYPLLAPHHISYSVFIAWFLIATTLSQAFNPTGFLLLHMRQEAGISYYQWFKWSIYKILAACVIILAVTLLFFR